MFFLTLKNSVWFEDLDRGKVIYKYEFDPFRLDERELLWLIKAYKELKQKLKNNDKNVVDNSIELYKEIEKIIDKGSKGNGRMVNPMLFDKELTNALISMVFDPSLRAVPALLVGARKASSTIGVWWCNGGSRGKFFSSDLCTEPEVECDEGEDYCTGGRRAIAVNPWSIPNWADLDTIIGDCGNKVGSIGEPVSYSRSVTDTYAVFAGTFSALADTKVKSVLFLVCTYRGYTSTGCSDHAPAPPGTCDSDNYASVYLPLWGWNVDVAVSNGITYSVNVKFEAQY